MSKAILVIDMPESCGKCPLCASYQGHTWDFREYWCPALNHADVDPLARKPYDCPLKLLPEREDYYLGMNSYSEGRVDGWNDCINELLGD